MKKKPEDFTLNTNYPDTTLEETFDHDDAWEQKEASCNNHHTIGEYFRSFDNGKYVISFMLSGSNSHTYIWKCVYSDYQSPAC